MEMMAAQKLDRDAGMQALTAAESGLTSVELRWHVLLTEPNCEFRARNYLRDLLKFNDAYVPVEVKKGFRTVSTMFGVQRRPYQSARPIFRGYLFLPLNLAWSFGPLYSTPGLRQNGHPFLKQDDHFATLDHVDIALIRKVEEALENPAIPGLPYKVGDKVRVVEGPFMDLVAEIARLDDEARIELLMDILGRKTTVFASARHIVATD